ncbi:phage baseplate assembly protein V [Streptomyces sp. NPDC058257]|uniref:phage baseplate assembly protein V n=1 Tax=Streptomyces sp. NPDC058257 TaxID=3346409 RepID=UPI0036ED2C04
MTPLFGTYSGIVVSAQDPQNRGRARLRIPQIMGTAVSGWAEPVALGATLPGDQVYVSFDGGDRNFPVFWPKVRTGVQGWIPLSLESGWSEATMGPPMARLGADGVIELAGSVQPATVSLGVTTKFSTMPQGLVPLHRVLQPVGTYYRSSFTAKTVMGEYRVTSTTSSTSFVTDANGPTVGFVAPGSGQVVINFGMFCQNDTADGRGLMGVQVKDGSTVVTGPDDNRSAELQSPNNGTVAMAFTVTGLTPGHTYTAVAMYRTDNAANTASMDNKWIQVTPVGPFSAPIARVTIEPNGDLKMLYPDGQSSPYEASLAGVRVRAA